MSASLKRDRNDSHEVFGICEGRKMISFFFLTIHQVALYKTLRTKISRLSAYALAIFTEYTAWAAFREYVKKCSGDLYFYNRNANEVLNMRIWG